MRAWWSILLCAVGVARAAPALESWSINIEPWGFEHSGEGISPSFLRYLADAAQLPLAPTVRPYLRVVNGLASGENTLTMLAPSPDRDRIAIKLCQPSQVRISLIYRRESIGAASGPADFAGRRVGTLRGSHALDAFDAAVPHVASLVNTQEQGLRMLQAQHLDGTICARPGCGAAIKASGLNPADYGELPLGISKVAVYVSRASALAANSAALARLRAACLSREGQRRMEQLTAPWE